MAILLSLIFPGLGHLYNGRLIQGVLWFCVTMAGYTCLFVPGLILHVLAILDAARDGNRVKSRDMQRQADMMADAFARKR